MNQKVKLAYILAIVLSLAIGLASFVAVAKSENAKSANGQSSQSGQTSQNGKTEKNTSESGKSQALNLHNYAKPDKSKGETNGTIYREKTQEVTKNLRQVVKEERNSGNAKVSQQVQQVVTEQLTTQEQTAQAMEQVEKRNKVKTFLLGSDYKNLGQLRSELVQNRNQIRSLIRTMNEAQNDTDKTAIENQLTLLMQERERIKSVVTANEGGFSLFGWVSRFLNNYEMTPINQKDEDDLANEVEDAVDNADQTTDTGTDTGTSTDTDTTATDTAPTTPSGTTAPVE
jgi:hypothetical protein